MGSSYGRASTNTAGALIRLRKEVMVAEAGARVDASVPQVAIVITDGRSNVNASLTIPSARALKEQGTILYAVGVGARIDMTELRAIASSQEKVILLDGFQPTEFDDLRSRFTADICTGMNKSVLIIIEKCMS